MLRAWGGLRSNERGAERCSVAILSARGSKSRGREVSRRRSDAGQVATRDEGAEGRAVDGIARTGGGCVASELVDFGRRLPISPISRGRHRRRKSGRCACQRGTGYSSTGSRIIEVCTNPSPYY